MADLGNVQVTEALKKCPFCLQAHDPKITCPERMEAMRAMKRCGNDKRLHKRAGWKG
jgi:hypothetical protein